jgi:hypothetical protein
MTRHPDNSWPVASTAMIWPGPLGDDLREVANTLADLIIGGLLVSGIEDQADDDNRVGEA